MASSSEGQNKYKYFAAIDFGTTYSGYAFSTKEALDKNPTDISTIVWEPGSSGLLSSKVPTCILFDSNKEFYAFGYDAENKYFDLAFDGKHKDWYFFRHFKMSLYNTQRLNRNYTMEDEFGKSMPALDLFCESIRFLKNHMMSTVKIKTIGGTVDITVHSVRKNRGIDELYAASGGNWGGSYVDEAFVEFLNTIFGKQFMNKFCMENTIDTLDLQREFEWKKGNMSLLDESCILLRLPRSLVDLYKDENNYKTVQTCLESSALHGKVKIRRDRLRIDHSVAKTFFRRTSEELIEHLKKLFKMENVQNIDTLLVVGGFAESQFLKETFWTSFPEKRVVIPDDPGLAVLKGAVIFGHNPSIIKSRMSRYTYGFGINEPLPYLHFNENNVSEEDALIDENGVKCVINVFSKHVTKCQILEVDKAQSSQEYIAAGEGEYKLVLYISDELDPILVTDPSCQCIGSMVIHVGNRSDTDVRVNLRFGDTKIKVEVVILDTGETFDTEFDCLV